MTRSDPSEQIDRLAEEFLSSWRGGERPSIAEYAERHPQIAADIRELFPLLTTMENLKARDEAAADPADTRLGDYRLVREIGRGGMGIVYEAVQETLGRRVALKVLPAHTTRDPRYLERFRMEAQAAGRLQHPNIVPVIGYGEHDGIHYYTMQFVEGRGIDALLREAEAEHQSSGTGQRFERSARIILAAAEGVAAAHAHGVLHRDVKPSNLMLDESGKVWITDFGLCKEVGSDDLTQSGDILGTLRYMPPERLQGESDVQGDVYGLGVTLYEMLTLTPAFDDQDRMQLFARIAKESPKRPRAIDPRIPADLEAIVLKAIDRDRKRRYATADALASDLRAILEGRPIAARAPTFGYYVRTSIRRHKPLAITAGLAALVLLASTVYYVQRMRTKESDARYQTYIAHVAAAEAALGSRDDDGARRLLAAAPAEFRNWEWHHLSARVDENLQTIDLGKPAYGISYSPDGRWLAVGVEREARIYRRSDAVLHASLALASYATMVRWDPSGQHIAIATTAGIELWNWPAAQRVQHWVASEHVSHVEFSPDGRLLAGGGNDGMLRVWNVADQALEAEMAVHSVIHSLDFHPDGRRVLTGSWDGLVALWDLRTRARLWSRRGSRSGLHGVCCVGSDLVAAATQAPHATVWSVLDGTVVQTLSHKSQKGVATVFVSPDQRYVLIGAGHSVHVWDAHTWEHVVRRPMGMPVNDVAFHPSSTRFAVASPRGRVAECGLGAGDHHILRGHIDDVMAVAYAPSGAFFVTAGFGGIVRLWDARRREQARAWVGHRWTALCLSVSSDSRRVAAGDAKGDVLIWDVASDEPVLRLAAHEGRTRGVAYVPGEHRVASVGSDGALALWDGRTGQSLARLEHEHEQMAVAVHPSGGTLATSDALGLIHIHDAQSLRVLKTLRGHTGAVTSLAYSRDGARLASVSMDQTLRLWDLSAATVLRTFRAQASTFGAFELLGVACNRDGSRIATCGKDGTVRLWDPETGQLVITLGGHDSWVADLAFSPDGAELLAVNGAAEVRVYDTRPPGARFTWTDEDAELRASGAQVVEAVRLREAYPDGVIAAVKARVDLAPAAREAALRAAHRWRGSEDGLVARLWRHVLTSGEDPDRARLARGLAADLTRASGHRNRQDSRRLTLWGALTCRSTDYALAVERLERARMLNEERHPELLAVDLAFLAMAHAGLADKPKAEGALVALERLLTDQPSLRSPRLDQFHAEALAAVAAIPAAPSPNDK